MDHSGLLEKQGNLNLSRTLSRDGFHIVQRNWRGDIDDPKSKTSKRPLTLGYLVDRYREKAKADKAQPEKWVFARTDGSGLPLWDSGVRQALKRAAAAEGCDFPGLGPHSFRRASSNALAEEGGVGSDPGVVDSMIASPGFRSRSGIAGSRC